MTAPRPRREQLRFLPIALSTAELHALVAGGGREALLKSTMLCRYGARVTVCSAEPCAALRAHPGITLLLRPFDEALLTDVSLVYACEEDRERNRAIGAAARARGLLVNVVDDPTHCDFVTPALFEQGEMCVAVSSNGRSVRRSIAWRDAIRALFEPTSPTAELARAGAGKVWLVGFGPGDPELLTRKADRILAQADVLFYDDLIDPAALARYRGRKHYVGKRGGHHDSTSQGAINAALLAAATRGEQVARVKAGDPSIFSRGGEELAYLRAQGIEVEIIPGVSAAHAAAASAGLPLTMRGVARRVELRTGHCCAEPAPEAPRPTVVYYMAAARLAQISAELLAEGWPGATPVALIEQATRAGERCLRTTLAALPDAQAASPLTVIVGEVVALAAPAAFAAAAEPSMARPSPPPAPLPAPMPAPLPAPMPGPLAAPPLAPLPAPPPFARISDEARL